MSKSQNDLQVEPVIQTFNNPGEIGPAQVVEFINTYPHIIQAEIVRTGRQDNDELKKCLDRLVRLKRENNIFAPTTPRRSPPYAPRGGPSPPDAPRGGKKKSHKKKKKTHKKKHSTKSKRH
jgi:hypothetical protein